MTFLRTLFDPEVAQQVRARLSRLRPDSPRRWGRMTPHEAVCHLSDGFRASLGERKVPVQRPGLQRRVMRFVAFTLPLRWPRGVQTSAEVDPKREGTQPAEFEADRRELERLLEAFLRADGRNLPPHFVFGEMSRSLSE
ncbi:MAG: hypothetical protein ACE5GJ_13775 [Gemmatimonadota bacterium]